MNKKDLVILGTSMLGPEVLDLIDDIGGFRVVAFVENQDREKATKTYCELPVIWFDDAVELARTHLTICALGTTHRWSYIEQAEKAGFKFATIIHPTARISNRSSVGTGSIISCGVIVANSTEIGRHVFINRGSLLGHNVKVDDFATISPGSNIGGVVTIGVGAYVGIGATILDRISIGERSVVGAGALVTKDVPAHVQVIGVPARITRENINGR